ncbi:hypothetical protein LZ30DRAFT_106815 [Colletotrichum cereale]|nr:hypothetical protein LZ30DRAFT_106815 [Colletotrichum cereale]
MCGKRREGGIAPMSGSQPALPSQLVCLFSHARPRSEKSIASLGDARCLMPEKPTPSHPPLPVLVYMAPRAGQDHVLLRKRVSGTAQTRSNVRCTIRGIRARAPSLSLSLAVKSIPGRDTHADDTCHHHHHQDDTWVVGMCQNDKTQNTNTTPHGGRLEQEQIRHLPNHD